MRNNREKALAALLSSDTQAEAAAKIGVTDRTMRGYLADPEFRAEYQRRKRRLVSDATRQMQASYQAAINALREIVESKLSSEAGRISAARALLEYGMKFTEVNEIMTQMDNIENAIKNDKYSRQGWEG